jgi:hypothetical protein
MQYDQIQNQSVLTCVEHPLKKQHIVALEDCSESIDCVGLSVLNLVEGVLPE